MLIILIVNNGNILTDGNGKKKNSKRTINKQKNCTMH